MRQGEKVMQEQIEVVYENGVLRPLGPLPLQLREHSHLTVTIESGSRAITEAGRFGLADEARRQSLLASRKPGEPEALTFIDNAADTGGPA
jgi:predicted DNA-binding antitoxin AbrB/MazE fold protein